jgi:hypothetical protein
MNERKYLFILPHLLSNLSLSKLNVFAKLINVLHIYLTLNPPFIHFRLENKILLFFQLKALNYLINCVKYAINGAKWKLKAGIDSMNNLQVQYLHAGS